MGKVFKLLGKNRKKVIRNVFWFSVFLVILLFESFLIAGISKQVPDNIETSLGPFSPLYFLWGLLILILYIILRKVGYKQNTKT